ncbi:hypothetical protein TEA_008444 [Camellia sinensis var. sinensis]|uniref:non-specific serine/threonine protein kinase n=1 Tax=Camellia sinensis var. sinensis TaxID=542762 RepID=A0A4S4DQZ5_CAMSN|nr:hypothetical protein TEA_008444 [Camellia sinensis var. sinensis]
MKKKSQKLVTLESKPGSTPANRDISENKFPSLPLPDKSITKNWNLFSCCSNITDMPIEAWGQQDYHCDNKKLKSSATAAVMALVVMPVDKKASDAGANTEVLVECPYQDEKNTEVLVECPYQDEKNTEVLVECPYQDEKNTEVLVECPYQDEKNTEVLVECPYQDEKNTEVLVECPYQDEKNTEVLVECPYQDEKNTEVLVECPYQDEKNTEVLVECPYQDEKNTEVLVECPYQDEKNTEVLVECPYQDEKNTEVLVECPYQDEKNTEVLVECPYQDEKNTEVLVECPYQDEKNTEVLVECPYQDEKNTEVLVECPYQDEKNTEVLVECPYQDEKNTEDKQVKTNFNIVEQANGVDKSITHEFKVHVDNSRLEIHLYWAGKGSTGYRFPQYGPLISGISVHRVKYKLPPLVIAGIVASALLILALALLSLWKLGCFRKKGLHDEGFVVSPYPYRVGVLLNGTAIAVKQLSSKSRQGIREFVNEVGTISALQHPNLVKLLGCCAEDNQLLLVYEFMENNSLAHALFGSDEVRSRLNWPTRVQICLGIAKGLTFLHEESKLKIVHRDIKPTNILLDKDFNAKISDFGFAKLYEEEVTHVVTKIAGTTGYMAPEYAMRGHLTNKADVYSFGVVTLEIVSGKNSTSYRPNDENVYLLDLAPPMSEVVKTLEGKSKIVGASPSAPYSMDDSAMAEEMAGFSQSAEFGSTSQEGTSNANSSSQAVSKESAANRKVPHAPIPSPVAPTTAPVVGTIPPTAPFVAPVVPEAPGVVLAAPAAQVL